MSEALFHIRSLGGLGLILLAVLALRALADLPTMIWLRPRLAGVVTGAVLLVLFAGGATMLRAPSSDHLYWLALLLALVVGLPASREIADAIAFHRDAPAAKAVQASQAATAKKAVLDEVVDRAAALPLPEDPAFDADVAAATATEVAEHEQHWAAAETAAEAARLLADLTGKGALAYRGHIYRKAVVDARWEYVRSDEQPLPWILRWRSVGPFVKGTTVRPISPTVTGPGMTPCPGDVRG